MTSSQRRASQTDSRPSIRPAETSQASRKKSEKKPVDDDKESSHKSYALKYPAKHDNDPSLKSTVYNYPTQGSNQTRPETIHQSDKNTTRFLHLKGRVELFVAIERGDFDGQADFVDQNPDILRLDVGDLLAEAVEQFQSGDENIAKNCIASLAIINLWRKYKNKAPKGTNIGNIIRDMDRSGSSARNEFQTTYSDVLRHACELAAKPNVAQDGLKPRTTTAAVAAPSADSNKDQDSLMQQLKEIQIRKQNKKPAQPQPAEKWIEQISELMPSNAPINANDIDREELNKSEFSAEELTTLYTNYKLQNGKFFEPGRVFALLWHEAKGQARVKPSEGTRGNSSSVTKGPYNSEIFSHIRRMVVIRNRNGYCWCIAINSYNKLGLKKKGLRPEEVQAHAIIYDRNQKATWLPNEPRTSKRPIAVKMEGQQTLVAASRLHYGQPHSVQWNQPVLNVGMVDKKSIDALRHDVIAELIGENLIQQS